MNKKLTLSFRWVLPIAQLLVCAALVWPWTGFLVEQLQAVAHSHWPTRVSRPVIYIDTVQATRTTPKQERAMELMELRITAPQLLNLPCFALGLGSRRAVPTGILPNVWRSISWPFFGAIFWWIAGRGIDALLASRLRVLFPQISWGEVLVALVVIALCSLIWGLYFSGDRSGFIFPWRPALAASTLWTILGAVTIAARLRQRRIQKQPIS